jgi:hypothetical protein
MPTDFGSKVGRQAGRAAASRSEAAARPAPTLLAEVVEPGPIIETILVPDADILVGVPCYKDGAMVARCLASLAEPGVQRLLIDNGGAADIQRAVAGQGIVIRNRCNRYVNPAWNQVLEVFLEHDRYELLVLANSDLILDPGWPLKLREHRQRWGSDLIQGVDTQRRRPSGGTFFALSRCVAAAVHPIPSELLVLGGDDWIFSVARGLGLRERVVPELTMHHVERGTYDKSPEVWPIARRDIERWRDVVCLQMVPQRIIECS